MKKIHDYRQLRAFIAAIAPLGMLSGCSSLGDFDGGSICRYDEGFMADLTPAEATDYVAVRSAQSFGLDEELEVNVDDVWGTKCATATDPSACAAALAALPLSDPLRTDSFQVQTLYDIVYSRGDETGTITEPAALAALLGVIDTPDEAMLMAFANGHDAVCGENNWRKQGDGYVLLAGRGTACGEGTERVHYEVIVGADGQVTEGESEVVERGDAQCAIGRRPDGLCSRTGKSRSVGRFFANATHLEAASVPAFAQLARELAAHGAPPALVRAALRARADEIRHARRTAALARRFGAEPVLPVVEQPSVRPLYEVARDNGIEGCVRETFGALVATAQARRAQSRAVRRAMGPIARDETRHATLSWAIDAWLQTKLSARERRAIAEGRREAVRELRRETQAGWSRAITTVAGMPDAEAGMRLLAPMDAALWNG